MFGYRQRNKFQGYVNIRVGRPASYILGSQGIYIYIYRKDIYIYISIYIYIYIYMRRLTQGGADICVLEIPELELATCTFRALGTCLIKQFPRLQLLGPGIFRLCIQRKPDRGKP